VWITRAGLPRCSILERPTRCAAFSSMHRDDRSGGNEKRFCYQRRSWCTNAWTGPLRLALTGAVRLLVGPNDLSALETKQAHGLVVDGVKYVENRQERCGASWAAHLMLFSRFVARAFFWILAIHSLSPNTSGRGQPD
jgi:hypothetical protein